MRLELANFVFLQDQGKYVREKHPAVQFFLVLNAFEECTTAFC